MGLVPVLGSEDPLDITTGVYLDESAFGFLEPCIIECWPAYAKYGHWGESKIPVDVWCSIAALFLTLRTRLEQANSPEEVDGIGFVLKEIKVIFFKDFQSIKTNLIQMISDVITWLNEKIINYNYIYIMGI